jgi:hypothetical protein
VTVGCSHLFYICRTHGLVAKPALELLISNPLESRAPVAPALAEQVSRPLVSNRTLRGSDFSSTVLGPFERFTYVVMSQSLLMPTVMAMVVRCGRAFSGDTAARIVGDVGVGRDRLPRPFGFRAVMIVRARAPDRFGVVGSACR